MHMSVCLHVPHVHTWHLRKPGEGFRSPGMDVRGLWDTCGCWELKPGSSADADSALNHCTVFPAMVCEVQSQPLGGLWGQGGGEFKVILSCVESLRSACGHARNSAPKKSLCEFNIIYRYAFCKLFFAQLVRHVILNLPYCETHWFKCLVSSGGRGRSQGQPGLQDEF